MEIPFISETACYQYQQTFTSDGDPAESSQCPSFSDFRYKFQPNDNFSHELSSSSPEYFWSTCPLAGYYIAKEDNVTSSSCSNTMCVSSITKADSAEIPSYLDLTTWKCNNNLKVCQSHQAIEPKQSIELFETDTGCSGPKLVPEAPSTESISSQSGCPESDSSLVTLFGVDDSNPSSFEDDERDTDSYDDSTTSNDDQSFRSTVLSEERKHSHSGTCVICGDGATGFHYKVMACEGCKGFFRRSVEKNTQYKCHRNNFCQINKMTRNRCQACRFKKCLQMGMCKESVRRDRCNKRKRKSLESFNIFMSGMDDSMSLLVRDVIQAHRLTYTSTDIRSENWNQLCNNYQESHENILWDDASDLSTTGILRVITFSKKIPGFMSLCIEDQIILLKHSCIEIMMIRMCTRYFPELDGFHFYNGTSLSRTAMEHHLGPLARLMIDMAESLIRLSIDDTEISLLQAICLLSSERPGLKYRQQVQHYEEQVSTALMMHACKRRLTRPLALHEIIKSLFSLRLMGRIASDILMLPGISNKNDFLQSRRIPHNNC